MTQRNPALRRLPAAAVSAAALLTTACVNAPATAPEPPQAKNVILFIGDGMGVSTVTAARIYDGQSQGMNGEEHSLAFERFPNVALVKTYNTNQQVPDSAGTATAMVTGTKTRAGMINVGPEALRSNCAGSLDKRLTNIAEIAKDRGLAAGFVTTARVTHATPATVYAHLPERDWEYDRLMTEEAHVSGCRDMARQLVEFNRGGGLDIMMGGGRRGFFGADKGGKRINAGDDLVTPWLAAAPNRRYVETAAQLEDIESGEQVLGLFAAAHMTYVAELDDDSTEPSLSEMTAAAIDLLDKRDTGYFLMVEGGRIDHGHHDGKPGYALIETQEFSRAVQAALDNVDLEETLVLVTADHSHVFTMGGYPTRGNPILGLVVMNDRSGEPKPHPELADDGQPYTTLMYANGPGAVRDMPRPHPELGIDAVAQSLVPVKFTYPTSVSYDETHGGEDVALYGIGAGAEHVGGIIEQNRIFDIMMEAYGWADGS